MSYRMRPRGTGTIRRCHGKWWALKPRLKGARDEVLFKEDFKHVAERKLDAWVAGNAGKKSEARSQWVA